MEHETIDRLEAAARLASSEFDHDVQTAIYAVLLDIAYSLREIASQGNTNWRPNADD